jgi:hypothetical protein
MISENIKVGDVVICVSDYFYNYLEVGNRYIVYEVHNIYITIIVDDKQKFIDLQLNNFILLYEHRDKQLKLLGI